jgi:hypothetical protein
MAQVVVEYRVDDLDRAEDPDSNTPADTIVHFTLDGNQYEIDLTDEHAKGLYEALAQYRDAGRRVRASTRRPRATRQRSVDIRTWARQKKIKVSDRGRISAAVVAQYEAAHR